MHGLAIACLQCDTLLSIEDWESAGEQVKVYAYCESCGRFYKVYYKQHKVEIEAGIKERGCFHV